MTHFFWTFEQRESRRMQKPGGRKNAMVLRRGLTLSPLFSACYQQHSDYHELMMNGEHYRTQTNVIIQSNFALQTSRH